MLYLLLIYNREKDWETASDAQKAQIMERHAQLQAYLEQTSAYRHCGGLAPASQARCVRAGQNRTFVTDGPFAETREQVGGYYVVEAASLDEALGLAARIPMIFEGMAVEVRPVIATPDQ
jgi:hypothetical protein